MSMDLFTKLADQAELRALRTSAPDLPATFGDAFGAALEHGMLFGQSVANANARRGALGDYAEEVYRKTGDERFHPAVVGGDFDGFNAAVAKLDPALGVAPLTDDELERRAAAKSRVARADYKQMGEREKTWGGVAGGVAGGVLSAAIDPVNVLAFPLAAPAGAGLLATGLAWGGIGAGSQAVIEVAGGSFRERVEPGYLASGEPLKNVLEAAGGAAVIGGGIRGLGMAWEAVSARVWPRSIRDAGNAVNSERNIVETNPFAGVEGETAHRAAMQQSVDDLLAGRPVAVDDVVGGLRPTEQASESVAGFTTAKGSTYEIHPDGTTTRNKAARSDPGHEGDSGLKERSAKTVYVDEADIGRFAAPEKTSWRVADHGDGTLSLITKNDDGRWGVSPESKNVRVHNEPAVGRLPLELWEKQRLDGYNVDTFRKIHPGNAITEVRQQSSGAAQAELPLTPPVGPSQIGDDLTPKRRTEVRGEPETDDAVLRDLDRLRADRDVLVPFGETVDAQGNRVAMRRSIDDVLTEIETRERAAAEIKACVIPPAEAA